MPSLAACRPFMAGLLPTTTLTSGANAAANASRRMASMSAYISENQCVMAPFLFCVLRIGHHPADGAERGIDRFEIVPLHDLPKLALLGAVGRGIDQLQGKAESQSRVVVAAEDLVDDEAVDVAGLAHEDDLFFRV